jgi:hypothetical protein
MNERKIEAGVHYARMIEWKFGLTYDGKPFLSVIWEVTTGPAAGCRIQNRFWLTPNALEFTKRQLENAGWRGGPLSKLDGFGDKEVALRVVLEEHEGKVFARVKWVNPAPSLDKVRGVDAKVIDALDNTPPKQTPNTTPAAGGKNSAAAKGTNEAEADADHERPF